MIRKPANSSQNSLLFSTNKALRPAPPSKRTFQWYELLALEKELNLSGFCKVARCSDENWQILFFLCVLCNIIKMKVANTLMCHHHRSWCSLAKRPPVTSKSSEQPVYIDNKTGRLFPSGNYSRARLTACPQLRLQQTSSHITT